MIELGYWCRQCDCSNCIKIKNCYSEDMKESSYLYCYKKCKGEKGCISKCTGRVTDKPREAAEDES